MILSLLSFTLYWMCCQSHWCTLYTKNVSNKIAIMRRGHETHRREKKNWGGRESWDKVQWVAEWPVVFTCSLVRADEGIKEWMNEWGGGWYNRVQRRGTAEAPEKSIVLTHQCELLPLLLLLLLLLMNVQMTNTNTSGWSWWQYTSIPVVVVDRWCTGAIGVI